MESGQLKLKIQNKTVYKHRVPQATKLFKKTEADTSTGRGGEQSPGYVSVPQAARSCLALRTLGLKARGHVHHRHSYDRSFCQKKCHLAHKAVESI